MNTTQQRPPTTNGARATTNPQPEPLRDAPTDVTPPKPAAPSAYDIEFIFETAEGFHVLWRGTGLTPANALNWTKAASAQLAAQGFKPVRRDIAMPPQAAHTAGAAPAQGEAVWIKGEGGRPPKCSLHGPGKWMEGVSRQTQKEYAFWACQTRGCRPKGEPV